MGKKKVTGKPVTKKGFTLIELLAVIIILGIIMIIAVPSVTKNINDAKKNVYVENAKEIASGASNLVNEGKLGMFDKNTTYYIPTSYIKTEKSSRSPYGDFTEAYVGVIYSGTGYKYYWISVDEAGQGVSRITSIDKLDKDDIESGLEQIEINNTVKTTGIGARTSIKILDENGLWTNYDPEGSYSDEGLLYPPGKDKYSVQIGDIVKIDNERFFVYKRNGDDLFIIAYYNLNVGDNKDPNYEDGIQLNVATNGANIVGGLSFSNTDYWNGQVGEGKKYPGNFATQDYPYVYDENSNLYTHVNDYKSYLESKGIVAKEARLISVNEMYELGYVNGMNTANLFLSNTSFWLGSASHEDYAYFFYLSSGIKIMGGTSYSSGRYGVRPVIVI